MMVPIADADMRANADGADMDSGADIGARGCRAQQGQGQD